jgi:AraC family transcriptional regulator
MQSHTIAPSASHSRSESALKPPVASSSDRGWNNLLVEHFHQPTPGQLKLYNPSEHAICLCLAPRPFQLVQVREGQIHRGLHGKGDVTITPAGLFALEQWDREDLYLRLRLASDFLNKVAIEALEMNPDNLEITSECRTRDPQIEYIGMTLFSELYNQGLGGNLYIESLANILAVHLLRNYSTVTARTCIYTGGLLEHQLKRVTEYIHEYLGQDIMLSDLAQLLGMSQFHFGRCFKQSIGMSPHQYVIQQRVEKAKHLLSSTDLAIADIALQCGFNSQSHFGQWFRKVNGVTPKAYRCG